MPTSEVRARKLLKKGNAVIEQYRPFTIRLTRDTGNGVQDIEISEDTGYQNIGLSVKSEKHEYYSAEFELLRDEKQRHEECRREHRRPRRNRKRYRKPRFNNRKGHELAPSIQNKADRHISLIKQIIAVCPIKRVTLEMGQFDIQVLKAVEEGRPVPVGKGYQQGDRYGYDTLREAVFQRDGHKCQVCGKGGILRTHHVGYWKNDRSDRMSNLMTVCNKCHTGANHKKSGKLWGLEPRKTFRSAAFMNTVRRYIYDNLKNIVETHITYGVNTKRTRIDRNIKKSHANDAYCIGDFYPKHRTPTKYFKKRRRNNRRLEKFYDAKYVDVRDGKVKKGTELSSGRTNRSVPRSFNSLRVYRGKKISKGRRSIRTVRYSLQPGDIVLFNGQKQKVIGVHSYGKMVKIGSGHVSVSKVKLLAHASGWVRHDAVSHG